MPDDSPPHGSPQLVSATTRGAGFLTGIGAVLAVFGLMNKQTFLNQWVFSAQLMVAGIALTGGSQARGGRGPPDSP